MQKTMAENEKPGAMLRFLMWLDPVIFYAILLLARGAVAMLDFFILSPFFGWTIRDGSK